MDIIWPGEGLRIIDAVQSPTDLHALTNEELAIVAAELRGEIVQGTLRTGGHLASSLGAVETIVALHAELDCPPDRIVYDVGHQAYAHKLLTGRLRAFGTLRQHGGLSGFPNPLESPCDAHTSGHASDSLSVALGIAKARDLRGGSERVVALIGDGAISGGMAFEALNQIGQDRTSMVIVLNDNGMSISPNVGALSRHFGTLRASNLYRDRRDVLMRALAQGGAAARAAAAAIESMKGSFKHLVLPESTMVFEQLGITCMAPVNGHDIAALRSTLRQALASHGPTLVHVVTRKGAGYEPAEQNPTSFHSVSPARSRAQAKAGEKQPTFTDIFGATLIMESRVDDRVVGITAGMEDGTGLASVAASFPERVVDVGIAEEHALGLAAGYATGGAKPVVAIYSTFLQRAIDQLVIDIAIPSLDVVVCVDRAGVAGEDGVTHQGAFDLSYLRMVPNLRILAPSDGHELELALHTALALGGPFAIRYPKGACPLVGEPDEEAEVLQPGVSRTLREGTDVALLAVGSMVRPCLEAAGALEEQGISARVVDLRWAKPLDVEAIRAAAETKLVVTAEEGVLAGGVGEGVLGVLAREGLQVPVATIGLPDAFVEHGARGELLAEMGLDAAGIARTVLERLN